MTTTRSRSRRRVLSVGAASVALGGGLLCQGVLSAPLASANCSMSPADDQYIQLLAQNKMVHTESANDCNMTAEGRWFANQVRGSNDPLGTARSLMKMITETTSMNADQAEWEVESAVFVYAPEMVPKIKDEAAHEPPPPEA